MKKIILTDLKGNEIKCTDYEDGIVVVDNKKCKCCGIQLRWTEFLDNEEKCEYC